MAVKPVDERQWVLITHTFAKGRRGVRVAELVKAIDEHHVQLRVWDAKSRAWDPPRAVERPRHLIIGPVPPDDPRLVDVRAFVEEHDGRIRPRAAESVDGEERDLARLAFKRQGNQS